MEAIRKILRTPSALVLLIVAIFSLIGVIVKSEADKAIARIPIDATSTAEARLTEIANFSNMTQSVILPSTTWTPAPTNTETLTPPVVEFQTQTLIGIWLLNPVLPEPENFIGWVSSQTPKEFEQGIWIKNEQVTINSNQLVLIFGGLANLPPIGEIGTKTSCFLIASRGPNTFSVDLLSPRIEIHEVELTATSLAWAAQKVKVLQDTYPNTCGKGIDVVIGK